MTEEQTIKAETQAKAFFHAKVGKKGDIIIPYTSRRVLEIKPGDFVYVAIVNHVTILKTSTPLISTPIR